MNPFWKINYYFQGHMPSRQPSKSFHPGEWFLSQVEFPCTRLEGWLFT